MAAPNEVFEGMREALEKETASLRSIGSSSTIARSPVAAAAVRMPLAVLQENNAKLASLIDEIELNNKRWKKAVEAAVQANQEEQEEYQPHE